MPLKKPILIFLLISAAGFTWLLATARLPLVTDISIFLISVIALLWLNRDMGLLEKAKKELQEGEHKYLQLIQTAHVLLYVTNRGGYFTFVSKHAAALTGYTDAELLGQHYSMHIDPEMYDELMQYYLRQVREKIPVTHREFQIITKNGERKWVEQEVVVLYKDGEMKGYQCWLKDISERIKYEQELIHARKVAEDAKRQQEMFLANMSHEIRTPMNGIIGMTNLLLNTSLTLEQKEYIQATQQSASNLLAIINEILDFSKIRSGKMALEQIAFHFRELMDKTLLPLQLQAQQKGLHYSLEIADEVPDHLLGDPVRFTQIMVNLVENAIKFTPGGAIGIRCRVLATQNTRVRIGFEVSDTGIGIPADKQEIIFESFTQSNAENTRRYGGTGLGLAITRELVALQGGSLTVKSKEGAGTTFYCEIPFTKNLFLPETQSKGLAAATQLRPVLQGKMLLVAEDNIINQRVAYNTLHKAGARVDIAADGKQVLTLVQQKEYDCIIMDIQMPEMDGYTTTIQLRKQGIDTPVIAMTAAAIKGEREKCLQSGMNDYISKPFVPEELYMKILDNTPLPGPGVVDFGHLRSILYNDTAYIKEMLQEFLTTMPKNVQEIQEAIQQQDWKRAAFLAHRLKSSLGIVPIVNAMETTRDLEKEAEQGTNIPAIHEKVQQLSAIMDAACQEVVQEMERL
ncbi:PAS domain S-box-containing protein [Chitinophaga rupis]|uniref:Sensory/regulatory protein RpfC n=1 Tax=Chitinophaga rupis TaxID=573321 RepID=A0A1H7JHC5_9BACT|nr:ATP-binding protein [Chitinophaga rupis]SEK72835.1 PAS domain S-box-containing protein [Chitinophaga rupis]